MGSTQADGYAGGTGRSDSEGAGVVVACVFIPHFPLRVEILRHPELDGLPLALTDLNSAGHEGVILTDDPVTYADTVADLPR